jgi:hypothetical protein
MNRRAFLKRVSANALVGAIILVLPEIQASTITGPSTFFTVEALGKTYKGTRDGRLYESIDREMTWRPVANFGSHCSVVSIVERQRKLFAVIGVQRFTFTLVSTDGREWRTVDAIPAA